MSLRHPKGEKTQNPPRLCRSDCAQSCPCSDGKRAEGCPEVAELHRHPLGYEQDLLGSCSTSDQGPSTIPSMDWVSAAAFASIAPVSLSVVRCVWSQLPAADDEDTRGAVQCCTQGSPDCAPWLLNQGLVRLLDEAEGV